VFDIFVIVLAASSAMDALAFLQEVLYHVAGSEAARTSHDHWIVCHILVKCAKYSQFIGISAAFLLALGPFLYPEVGAQLPSIPLARGHLVPYKWEFETFNHAVAC
jgi:hypothetical protein